MKVAVYYRNNDIRIEERQKPRISDGEIIVRMMASGICGTDVMEWYRMKRAPRVLGHEMAGEICETGKGIQGLKKGDRVFVSHHVPCYRCHHCINGNYTACESLHTGNYDPGGFSELIRVPEENVRYGTFLLPENVSFEGATLIESLGCVIAGQNRLDIKKGQAVLVIGSGVSGLLHIQLAKMKKVNIIATDINEYKLDKALKLGADSVLNANAYSAEELRMKNSGRLADIVIVCSASKQAITNALSLVERKGKILFFAVPEDEIIIPSVQFWRDEMSLFFSYGASPHDLKEAIELMKRGFVNASEMVTHRFPLSQTGTGFRIASEAKDSLKVVIVPDSKT